MSGVFHPLTAQASVFLPAFGAGGGHTRCVEMGWGVNSSVDARHCSVLYICKYFVEKSQNPLNIPDPEHWQKKMGTVHYYIFLCCSDPGAGSGASGGSACVRQDQLQFLSTVRYGTPLSSCVDLKNRIFFDF